MTDPRGVQAVGDFLFYVLLSGFVIIELVCYALTVFRAGSLMDRSWFYLLPGGGIVGFLKYGKRKAKTSQS